MGGDACGDELGDAGWSGIVSTDSFGVDSAPDIGKLLRYKRNRYTTTATTDAEPRTQTMR